MTTYTRRAVPAFRPLPSRGSTVADWLDEAACEAQEIRAADAAREAEGCQCCCCAGTCHESEEETEERIKLAQQEETGEQGPRAEWQDEGEGIYSFGVVTSWYDSPSAWFVPEGWTLVSATVEDCDDLKRYETAERIQVRRAPPPVTSDIAPLRVPLFDQRAA
jgi:hypothetical protein